MRRRWRIAAWLVLVVALYAVAVVLAMDVVSARPRLERWYVWLAIAAAAALLLLLVTIVRALWRVEKRARAGRPGARLTRRLVWRFALIAVPPAVVVYAFALNFLVLTVDAWFNVRLEHALDDALDLGRLYVNNQLADVERQSAAISRQLAGVPDSGLQAVLDQTLDRMDALQLAVLSRQGRVEAVASADPRWITPPRPDATTLTQLDSEGRYAAAEPLNDQLVLRVLLPIASGPGQRNMLQALYALPPRLATLSRQVEDARFDFERLKFLRGALKLSFALVLTFVVVLSSLAALLAAVTVSRRLLAPLGQLAQATHTLAEGRYDIDLQSGSRDELGFLSDSFRGMTDKLRDASERARASAAETERQRNYLNTVLERLSSGVLGLDRDAVLHTVNQAASTILGLDLGAHAGQSLQVVRGSCLRIAPLLDSILSHLASGQREWREEVRLRGDDERVRILMVRGTALGDAELGTVVVFDDLTELNRAQRDAAWAEVAQRLAHEVKNPLTPIQLSAERIQHRLADKLPDADASMLKRATATIVNQVDALKALVDAFSDYARTPRLAAEPLQLDALVRDVLDLYDNDPGIEIDMKLQAGDARVMADPGKLRQLLHNLIRNAQEAVGEGGPLRLEISTLRQHEAHRVELRVADNGPGLPDDFDEGWFEPYVTTKAAGSGLGLAVVKKIAEEHGGRIRAQNRAGGGAEFVLVLPVVRS